MPLEGPPDSTISPNIVYPDHLTPSNSSSTSLLSTARKPRKPRTSNITHNSAQDNTNTTGLIRKPASKSSYTKKHHSQRLKRPISHTLNNNLNYQNANSDSLPTLQKQSSLDSSNSHSPTVVSTHNDVASDVMANEYCGIRVFEIIFNGIPIMLREIDGYINATQILKAAGIEKGKRIRILDREVSRGEHEKVQGGCGKYQGTWVPFEKGTYLAYNYGIGRNLRPLFDLHDNNNISFPYYRPPTQNDSATTSASSPHNQ